MAKAQLRVATSELSFRKNLVRIESTFCADDNVFVSPFSLFYLLSFFSISTSLSLLFCSPSCIFSPLSPLFSPLLIWRYINFSLCYEICSSCSPRSPPPSSSLSHTRTHTFVHAYTYKNPRARAGSFQTLSLGKKRKGGREGGRQ